MPLIVTPLYAGLLTLLYLGLIRRVILVRRSERIDMGTGGNRLLERYVRGHANFAEHVPLALLLLAVLEIGGWPFLLLHVLGASLLVARFAHAYAFAVAPLRLAPRTLGTGLTLSVLLVSAALCLVQAFA